MSTTKFPTNTMFNFKSQNLILSPILLLFTIFGTMMTNPVVNALMKLPESFEVNADFDVKNKWQLAKPHIKCSVCKLSVQNIVSQLPDTATSDGDIGDAGVTEGDVYDRFDTICDTDVAFEDYEIGEKETGFKVFKRPDNWRTVTAEAESSKPSASVSDSDPDSKKAAVNEHGVADSPPESHVGKKKPEHYWMHHAMKEVCHEAVKAEDDSLVQSILKWKRKKGKEGESSKVIEDKVVEGFCAKVKQCGKTSKSKSAKKEEL